MKKFFALALASALTLSLLAGCGKKDEPSVSGSNPGSISSSSQTDGSAPDASSSSDSSLDEPEQPDASQSEQTPDQPKPDEPKPAQELKLNKTDFSLFKVGATYQLKAMADDKVTWSSSNEAVATVSETGLVTYVAPGKATITAKAGDLTASAVVYCKEDKNSKPQQKPEQKPESKPEQKPADKKVDLSAFSQTTQENYQFGFLSLLDHDLTEQLYPGLTAISTNQSVVNGCMMTNNMGELVLVEVKDSKDVESVKSILNARIKAMADGGAYYPAATEMWSQNGKVVSNGNYVMMVVHENHSDIVSSFNALFK